MNSSFFPTVSFLRNATIHGLKRLIWTKLNLRCLVWSLVVLAAATFCIWQLQRTMTSYFEYRVKITKSISELNSMDFPAITFCPNSVYNRLVVGSTEPIYNSAYSTSQPVPLNWENPKKLCSYEAAPKINVTYNSTGLPSNFLTLTDFFKTSIVDSYQSVLKCGIGDKSPNCTDWFLNKFTILGRCFTFNQSPNVVAEQTTNSSDPESLGYGGTLSNGLTINLEGRRGGIRFYLSANQSAFCIPTDQNIGGLVALLHDRSLEPHLSTQRLIDIPPGFAISVRIRQRKTVRNTENWPTQTCHKNFRFRYYPNETLYNEPTRYSINCLLVNIYRTCGCLPFYAPPDAYIVENIHGFQTVCPSNSKPGMQQCQLQVESLAALGKICKPKQDKPLPCEETRIFTSVTTAVFPSAIEFNSIQRKIPQSRNMTKRVFRQNFMMATFYIDSLMAEVITVNPAMSWVDLMNQMGGAVGMSLGISLLSLVEVLSWLMLQLKHTVKPLAKIQGEISTYKP